MLNVAGSDFSSQWFIALVPLEKKCRPRFGRQRIQAHVPGIGAHGVRSLALEAEPDQSRTHPVPAVAPEGESAIVESAAHSQAATLGIDADQRHDDEIEPARRDRRGRCGEAPKCRTPRAASFPSMGRSAAGGGAGR